MSNNVIYRSISNIALCACWIFMLYPLLTLNSGDAQLFTHSDNWFTNLISVPVTLIWIAGYVVSLLSLTVYTFKYIASLGEGTYPHFLEYSSEYSIEFGGGLIVCILLSTLLFDYMVYPNINGGTGRSLVTGYLLVELVFIMMQLQWLTETSGSSAVVAVASKPEEELPDDFDANEYSVGAGYSQYTNRDESQMRRLRNSKNRDTRKQYHDVFDKRGRVRNRK